MKWVTIKKAAELSGYSQKAIEAKRANGVWLEGAVWIKAPDGRILISPDAIDLWAEGRLPLPSSPQKKPRVEPNWAALDEWQEEAKLRRQTRGGHPVNGRDK